MKNIFTAWKGRGDDDGNNRGTVVKVVDHSTANIAMAAQMLYDCVHGVLSNGAALRGDDMSGFDTLLDSLNSEHPDDLNKWRYSQDASGFLPVLVSYLDHPEFIEICNQKNLGEALINALRLLRMLEIKQPQGTGLTASSGDDAASSGVSFPASKNLCKIFGVLCSSIQTVEQMRPVLTKLLCLPLQGFPQSGIHLQRHIAAVIATLCRRSLSSQIIWFLHDSQAVKFMVRAFQELVVLESPGSNQPRSTTLKGSPAEERELWLVAFESFSNLLISSYQFSSVLLGDLEVADGIALFVHVVVHSRAERCMKIVSALFDLLMGEIESKETAGNGSKFSEVSKIAPIFKGVLHAVLKLDHHVQGDETVESLIDISSRILGRCNDADAALLDGEIILQSLAFGFLTLCSTHIDMYVLLEQTHHIFATIVLCIPFFKHLESLVAVTKTLIFVGGEGRPSFEIISLCAASSVMLQNAIFMIDKTNLGETSVLMERLSFVLSIFEEVLNGDRKHSMIFSVCGLKYMICEPISSILTAANRSPREAVSSVENMTTFRQLLKILRTALRQNAFSVISDIKTSGLLELLLDIICCPAYRSEELLEFLEIQIAIITAEQDVELDFVLSNISKLILRLLDIGCYEKILAVLKRLHFTLTFVSTTTHSFAVSRAWQSAKCFECLMSVLSSMDGMYAGENSVSNETEGIIGAQKGALGSNSDQFHCMRAVFSIFSVFLTNPLEGYMFSYQNKANRIYFKDKIGYSNLAMILSKSGVLMSAFVQDVMDDTLSLVAGPAVSIHISNPEGMVAVIDLLPHLRVDLAKVAIDLIEQTVSNQIDGCQVLVEAGVTRHILNNFHHIISSTDHPLRDNMHQLLQKLCTEHLVLGDVSSILRILLRPELIVSSEDRMLLPPWQCSDTSGVLEKRSWYSVKLLNTLLNRTVRQQGTSYVSIGSAASYKSGESSYLSINWSDTAMGKPFPIYGMTASVWFQIEEQAAMKQRFCGGSNIKLSGSVLPLLTLISSTMGIYLEVHVDVRMSKGRIVYRKGKGFGVALFKVPYVSESDWHLCNISLKRPKRLMATKTQISVLLDGQIIYCDNVDLEAPSSGMVEVSVGKKLYGASLSSDDEGAKSNDAKFWNVAAAVGLDDVITEDHLLASSASQLPVALWRLGPFCVFEECLNQSQISRILMKGPSYHGNFQGESPLVDLLPTFVTTTLCRCNSSLMELSAQLDAMSMRAVEKVVVPLIDGGDGDNSRTPVSHVDMPSLPIPMLIFSGVSFVKNHSLAMVAAVGSRAYSPMLSPVNNKGISRRRASGLNGLDGKRAFSSIGDSNGNGVESYNTGMPRLALNNLAHDTSSLPQAELINGYHVSRVESMSRCVAAIGGPLALMPFVQAASTEAQLLLALSLVRNSTRNDPANMKYMQTGGYQLLSFLLTLKPKHIITETVVEALFLFAVDKGSHLQPEKMSRANDYRSLLVDTQALYHLVLNHQVWGADRYSVAFVVVDLLRGLVSEDAHHAILNAKRLSYLGVGRWLLLLTVYGVNKAVNNRDLAETERCLSPFSSPDDKASKMNQPEDPFADTREGNGGDVVWNISCRSAADMASRRDASDPFLIACLTVVRSIMICRLRTKDVELLAQLVINTMYSFDDVNSVTARSANYSAVDKRDHRMFASTNINIGPSSPAHSVGTEGNETKKIDEAIDSLFAPSIVKLSSQASFKIIEGDADLLSGNDIADLSPIGMMRVALIRLIRELYVCKIENMPETLLSGVSSQQISNYTESAESKAAEDAGMKQLFVKTLTPVWFLSAILKATDFASTAEILRLLFMQIQHDPIFGKAFCAADGMNVISKQFLDECVPTAVVLPILGLFFNVPMSKVPLPLVSCEANFVSLLGASDGPPVTSPDISEIFIPSFEILMGIFSVHARHKGLGAQSTTVPSNNKLSINPNDLIRTVILHAMSSCPLLREFMQFRVAINTTVLALLRCSDAMDDFGSRVYVDSTGSNGSVDLRGQINENYLDSSTGEVRCRDRISDEIGSTIKKSLFSDNTDSINLILPEGSCMLNIIRGIIADSIKFIQNPQVFSYLLLSFPRLVSDVYIIELHKLLIDQLAVVTKSLYVEVNLDYIATIVKMFSLIVPIAKARVLGDAVQFEILQLVFVLLDMFGSLENNYNGESEKFASIQKEFISVARYFSVMTISAMRPMDPSPENNAIKASILQLVRAHLLILFHDTDDDMLLPAKKKESDTIPHGVPVLDVFQLSIVGTVQANTSLLASARTKRMAFFNTTVSLVQAEILKISGLFSAYLFTFMHPLFLDDNYNVRVESMRIVAGLFHFRRQVMSSLLLGPNKDTNSDNNASAGELSGSDVGAVEGYMKLLPSNPKVLLTALKLYAGGTSLQQRDVDEGEDPRYADFIYWLSSSSYRHDLTLQYLENCLTSTLPSLVQVADVLKHIQGSRVLVESEDAAADRNSSHNMMYATPALRSIKVIYTEIVLWSLYGIADSASGAKLWNNGWMSLQCSPIWGALPLSSSDNISPPGARRIGWRLGYLEGPEKIRARMEEDFGTSLADDSCSIPAIAIMEDSPINEKTILAVKDNSNTVLENVTDDSTDSTVPIGIFDSSTAGSTASYQEIMKQIQLSGGFRKQHSIRNRDSGDLNIDNSSVDAMSPGMSSVIDADVVDADDFFLDDNSMSVAYNTNDGGEISPFTPAALISKSDSVFHTPPKGSPRDSTRYSFGGDNNVGDGEDEYEPLYDSMAVSLEALSPIVTAIPPVGADIEVNVDNDDNALYSIEEPWRGGSEENRARSPVNAGDRFDRFKDGVVNRMSSLVHRDSKSDMHSPSLKELNRKLSQRFSSGVIAEVLGSPGHGSSSATAVTPNNRESVKRRGPNADMPDNSMLWATSGQNESMMLTDLPMSGSGGHIIKNPYEMEESSRKFHLLNEIMKGLIGAHEWASGHTLNVDRIFGLESHPALLVMTPRYVHLLDGFQLIQSPDSSERLIEWTSLTGRTNVTTSFYAPTINGISDATDGDNSDKKPNRWVAGGSEEISWLRQIWKQFLRDDIGYFRISIEEIYSVFRRRYQLQDKALEITNSKGFSLLFACKSKPDCDGLLKGLLETDMSNSMFKIAGLNNIQLGGGLYPYRRVIAYYISYVQKLWLKGCMSNFEYLMHLNAAAGRSFQDLTQYPVFPWILSDYTSAELDLNNSNSFRDLTRPMGALGEKRAEQYKERFKTMNELMMDEQEEAIYRESLGQHHERDRVTSTPPFFYGTHYSCAGYVLHYLMRMQPFAGMAINLQGGQFDKPDRLFRSIGHAWSSASQDNLQDVRELIPEFFFLPDFLTNSNKYDLGTTQKGEKIDDVLLPPWANNSPVEFIRKHREALESRYVSENIHHWIDLIFGFKQLGKESEDSMNVFIHLTYEGEVDVDTIKDPMIRDATIAQINNFGQTPTRLFHKPHPKKSIPAIWKPNPQVEGQLIIDSDSVNYLLPMSPPFTVVGASHLTDISKVYFGQVSFPQQMSSKPVGPIGDLRMMGRDKVVAVPSGCFLMPSKFSKYIRYWRASGSIAIHPSQPSSRLDPDRDIENHDSLHSRPVSCVTVSSDGGLIATGSEDRSVILWAIPRANNSSRRLHHVTTFAGHMGSIICLDISIKLSIIVSGAADNTAMIWDIHNLKLLHVLSGFQSPVISVSINQLSGNIAVMSNDRLGLFDINGHLITDVIFGDMDYLPEKGGYAAPPEKSVYPSYMAAFKAKPRIVVAPPCADWQDGVAAITGHEGGYVFLWKIISESLSNGVRRSGSVGKGFGTLRKVLAPFSTLRTHRADITVIRLCHWNVPKLKPLIPRQFEGENGLELLIGDVDGYISRWDATRIDQMSSSEITTLTARHQAVVSLFSSAMLSPNNGTSRAALSTRSVSSSTAMVDGKKDVS